MSGMPDCNLNICYTIDGGKDWSTSRLDQYDTLPKNSGIYLIHYHGDLGKAWERDDGIVYIGASEKDIRQRAKNHQAVLSNKKNGKGNPAVRGAKAMCDFAKKITYKTEDLYFSCYVGNPQNNDLFYPLALEKYLLHMYKSSHNGNRPPCNMA